MCGYVQTKYWFTPLFVLPLQILSYLMLYDLKREKSPNIFKKQQMSKQWE